MMTFAVYIQRKNSNETGQRWLFNYNSVTHFKLHLLNLPSPALTSYYTFYLFLLFFISYFVQSDTCSFFLSILHTSSSYVIIFLYHFSQATVSIKLLICFCSIEMACPILER